MTELLRGNFVPEKQVQLEETTVDRQAEYEKKAIESIGGSMVFVERKKLFWDGK